MSKVQSEAYFIVKKGTPDQAFERRPMELDFPTGKNVLVEVEAFGLNYADVMARRGFYRDAPPYPCVVGYEAVGKIVAVGEDADQSKVGQRVLAFCRFGGYAKHVITQENATVQVEDQPAEELMALCTQGVTAYYMAEYLTPVHKIDTVLIHAAAGGVGTILLQLAKLKGATVIAKVGRSEKEELVKQLGADHVVNYNTSDYAEQVQKILSGAKIDVTFNPVGGSTFKKDMKMLGSGGRMILFGASEMSNGKWGILSQLRFVLRMGRIIPVGLVMKSKSILGVNMLHIADDKPEVLEVCLQEVVQLYRDKKLSPQVGGKYEAADLPKAHAALESGKTTGKLSVFW